MGVPQFSSAPATVGVPDQFAPVIQLRPKQLDTDFGKFHALSCRLSQKICGRHSRGQKAAAHLYVGSGRGLLQPAVWARGAVCSTHTG